MLNIRYKNKILIGLIYVQFSPTSTECWFKFVWNHLSFSFLSRIILYFFTCYLQFLRHEKDYISLWHRIKSVVFTETVSTSSLGKGAVGQLFHLWQQWIAYGKKQKFHWPYSNLNIFVPDHFNLAFTEEYCGEFSFSPFLFLCLSFFPFFFLFFKFLLLPPASSFPSPFCYTVLSRLNSSSNTW